MQDFHVPAWVQDAIFYQIFPDRFCNRDLENDPPGVQPWGESLKPRSFFGGDLGGILKKLDYLEDLGVSALYLTPIFKAPTNHKYDPEDYFQVDSTLGGDEALRELVSSLHARGMRIVLDGVFNHCGAQHPAFQDVTRRGRASLYWDWFTIWGDRVVRAPEPGYACFAGVPCMPEWNHKNSKVREHLLSVVRYWIREYEIDGWRLDTMEYLPPNFVRDIYHTAKEENPEVYILGEVMGGVATSWFKYEAVDGVMHYKLWEILVHFFAEGAWDATRFIGCVRSIWRSYPKENNYACYTLLGSHDKPRFLTLCQGDHRRLILAAAFLFSFPGAPAVYYGDEIGMEGEEELDCRRCFPWDEAVWNQEIRKIFRQLIHLRREELCLRRGRIEFISAYDHYLIFRRIADGEEIVVGLNAGKTEEPLPVPGHWIDLLSGEKVNGSVLVLPLTFRILKRQCG